jgi:predicted phage terminase large subunit-like protein
MNYINPFLPTDVAQAVGGAPEAPRESVHAHVDPVTFLVCSARTNFAAFVAATHKPRYRHSIFSAQVCAAIDKFVDDVIAGKRPVLMLTAPPQHGKSSLIARCLPPYLFGRLTGELPAVRIASASYAHALAQRNRRDAHSIMAEPIYRAIFPHTSLIGFKGVDNASDGLEVPGGGWLKGVGIGGPLTGFSVDVGIIDDAVKNAQEALSEVTQERNRDWYDSVFLTRLQLRSGQVIIGTPWSAQDLLAHVRKMYGKQANFTLLSFPALNDPNEVGYNPDLPLGALVPSLHDETKLREIKKNISAMWWAAMYQQTPLADLGAIFPRSNVQHYRRADLPKTFVRTIMSVDATFKDGATSDFVAVGVWGKTLDNKVWLLGYRRERLAFMATAQAIADLKQKFPHVSRIFIEKAANGEALIDMLHKHFPQIEGVLPLGSKEARAHAVSWVWAANDVMLPHPDESPGIEIWVQEITSFPDVAHDDTVDCMTIALQQLCLRSPIASLITREILNRA